MSSSSSCWSIVVILYCLTWSSVRLAEGYQDANGKWMACPEGYELQNNLCQKKDLCQEGYFLHTDGLCYLKNPLPCPYNTTEIPRTSTEEPTTTTEEPTTTTEEPTTTTEEPTTTTEEPTPTTEEPTTTTEEPTTTTEEPTTTTEEPTTTTEEPTTTTEEPTTTSTTEEPTTTTTEEPTTTTTEETILPIAPPSEDLDEQVRCPPGSIYFEEQCRRIICTRGEYHAGRCLSPACPRGTVWRNKSCQTPGYITTILEINNVIKNRHEYHTVTENVDRVEYVTVKPYDPNDDNSFKTTSPPPAELIVPSSTPAYSSAVPPSGCCLVKSPRFCRPYAPTWVCFNRSHKLCDPQICTHPVIYLKPPEIVQITEPPMLVMPPNPPLSSCLTSDCRESEMLDCSGCATGNRETCSTGCYNYFCPGDSCEFKRTEDFCKLYPGGFGCKKSDGCIWEWCTKSCH